MNKICQDVFNNIGNYLSIIDIARLKQINKLFNNFVNNFENVYLTSQLKINNVNGNIIRQKNDFYYYFRHIIPYFYMIKYNLNEFVNQSNVNKLDENNYFFRNKVLENMTLDIYNYYTNIYNSKNYPNILNLIIISSFTNIVYFPNSVNIDFGFNFLKKFNNNSKFKDIIIDYYIYILNSIHDNNVVYNALDKIYEISPHVINIYCLKKIFSYRLLDLSKTRIIFCCNLNTCVVDNIYEICNVKHAYYNDDLISHNYNEVKKILYSQSLEYYNILIYRENYLLNKKIFIKNPITNRRMRVNGSKWMELITFLKNENKNVYNSIILKVLKEQDRLRNKIFGKFVTNN